MRDSTELRHYPANAYQLPNMVAVSGYPLQVVAQFRDTWTIDLPLLTGTPGELELDFEVSGTRLGTLWLETQGLLFDPEVFLSVFSFPTFNIHPLKDGTSRVKSVVPFIYGTPFAVSVDLTGAVTVFDDFGAITPSYNLETSFNFGNTVRLVGMTVTDQTGYVVQGASLTAVSGAVYGAWPEPIPEPANVVAVFTGLALVAVRRFERPRGRRSNGERQRASG